MPRYFFNVSDAGLIADRTGVELASVEEARREAARLLGMFPHSDHGNIVTVVVTDKEGAIVCEAGATVSGARR